MDKYYENKNVKIYQCDNLELLKSLKSEYIDLIYCDILYGTGRNFGDYQDLKPIRKEIEEHYVPRLIEMKRVLSETGSIYLQMDTRINHWMRIIMDDIFGYENFQNEISWLYKSGGATKSRFNKKHDIILFYSKSKNFTFNFQTEKSYNRGFKPYRFKGVEEFQDEVGWYTMVGMKDYWEINMVGRTSKERNGYETQKPKELLNLIVNASSNPNDIVADFYMGSGTMGDSALELGRRFIGCDIGEKACRITKERLIKYE